VTGIDSDMFGQKKRGAAESVFRSQVVILLDRSQSMEADDRIIELWNAVDDFLAEDLEALTYFHETELAIGAFNSEVVWLGLSDDPVRPGSHFYLMDRVAKPSPQLEATRSTRLVDAIREGIGLLDERASELPGEGRARRHKPQLFVITDGAPDAGQDVDGLADLLAERAWFADSSDMLFFALGVTGAQFSTLRALAPQSSFNASRTSIRELLRFVSESVNTSQTQGSLAGGAADAQDEEDVRPFSPEYGRVNESIGMFATVRRNRAAAGDA
jgi:uncharacterized protein YegL